MTSPSAGPSPVITMTTDFGSADGYVAAMKGVILGINPAAKLVDVSNDVPPQNIAHGAFVLGVTRQYFPQWTIHLAVVDPGVGSSRRLLLVVTPEATYIAPDNGLLTYVLMSHGVRLSPDATQDVAFLSPVRVSPPGECAVYELNRDEHWQKPVSNTFHGRDILASVAGRLSRGVAPGELGEPIGEVVCLNIPDPVARRGLIDGRIIHIDHFGNLVSNVRLNETAGDAVEVEVEGWRIEGLSRSYAGATGLLAIPGSHGYLEIAVRDGNAAELTGAAVGARVTVGQSHRF